MLAISRRLIPVVIARPVNVRRYGENLWSAINQASSIAFDEISSYWSALKSPYFSAFHWSPRGNLVSIGQHFVITRVVHLPKRAETSLITESDRFSPIR